MHSNGYVQSKGIMGEDFKLLSLIREVSLPSYLKVFYFHQTELESCQQFAAVLHHPVAAAADYYSRTCV